jgi:ATP-binding cassette, subfamily B, bacterial
MNGSSRPLYQSLLRTYLLPHWRWLLVLLGLLVVGSGLTLLSPRILAAFIDVVFGRSEQSLWTLGGLFLGLAVVNQGITIGSNYLGTDIGLRATNRLRTDLLLHCLRLDMGFHNTTTPGELIERIDGDVGRLNEFFSTFAVALINSALLIVGALTAVALIDWRAGAVVAACAVVTLVALEMTRRAAVPHVRAERERSALLFGTLEERLAGIEDMRANGGTAYVLRRFFEQSRPWARATVRSHVAGATPWQVSSIMFALSLAATIGTAAWLIGRDTITIGAAYAMYRYVELIRWPLNQIGRQVQNLQQAAAAIGRLGQLFALHSAIRDEGTARIAARPVAVRFTDVDFSYPDAVDDTGATRSVALHDLSFELGAGRVLGLLGRTGSGKTTLARLLLRFYEPQRGEIALDGTPMHEIALRSLRERVGLVTQDVQIFNASVRDNLALFDPAIPDARMEEALEAVTLAPWLRSLPQGLDTVLPPGGGMSGGQAQLLAVARVLLHDPSLVILDEASSRLDPATERRLDDAFARLLQGRTAIIIAHRLQTVLRADNILILEGGRCVEWGERAALQADPDSRFSHLLRAGMEEALA